MNATAKPTSSNSNTDAAAPVSNPRAAAFHRIFEKVCEQLNFNERERAWFRDLLREELKGQ